MSNDNAIVMSDLPGLDGIPGIKCDIEINYTSSTEADDTGSVVAAALRALAAQIEAGALDTGFHPIKTAAGQKIGDIYLDHYATL
jgi:hypothetical protein